MRCTPLFLLFASIQALVFFSARAEALPPENFQFRVKLNLEEKRGPLSLALSPDILSQIKDAGDMRVFDSRDKEIPYTIHTWKPFSVHRLVPSKIVSSKVEEGSHQEFLIKLHMPGMEVNQISLDVKSRSFDNQVSVFGKERDDTEFTKIIEHQEILRIKAKEISHDYVHPLIRFEPQAFGYYLIKIHLRPEELPLTVNEISLGYHAQLPAKLYEEELLTTPLIDKTQRTAYSNVLRDSDTAMLFETKSQSTLPLHMINLETESQFPPTIASLYQVTNAGTLKQKPLITKTVFSLENQKQLTLPFSQTRLSKALLIIHGMNQADISLKKVTASGYLTDVRFFLDKNTDGEFVHPPPLWLYFKTPFPSKPKSNIDNRFSRMRDIPLRTIEHEKIEKNPRYKPKVPKEKKQGGFSEKNIFYFCFITALSCIVALFAKKLFVRK